MRVLSLAVALAVSANAANLPTGASFTKLVQRASDFTFDLFQGPRVQQEAASKRASELDYTTAGGVPENPYEAQRAGPDGPLLLQDFHLLETLAHFSRERIPERVVHAVAAGAHGYFETTTDFGKSVTVADFLQNIGTRTPITIRFSTVGGSSGSPDVVRDPRGFAIKLRTQKGILDWVFNNTPTFFLRDPAKFPIFIHTQKRHPQTHLPDNTAAWDYWSSNPEAFHQVLRLFSDAGTPYGFRHMDGFSGHTYRVVRQDGSWDYVKVRAISDQGIRNNTAAEAANLAASHPEFGTQDLYEAIERGEYPSWTVYMQIMSPEDAENFKYNVLDLTKDWAPEDVPMHEIGKLVLTQNPANYFAEIEQAAFAPSHMVEGWEPSDDPVLQSRLFSYPDAHRYRLGVNAQQLPVNCPLNPVASFQRDGRAVYDGNQGARPVYPSTIDPINIPVKAKINSNHTTWIGGAVRFLSQMSEEDWDWPRIFYNGLSDEGRDHLEENIAGHLGVVKVDTVKNRALQALANVDQGFSERIAARMAAAQRR